MLINIESIIETNHRDPIFGELTVLLTRICFYSSWTTVSFLKGWQL